MEMPPLGDGQVRCRVERVALTANTVSYATLGATLGYGSSRSGTDPPHPSGPTASRAPRHPRRVIQANQQPAYLESSSSTLLGRRFVVRSVERPGDTEIPRLPCRPVRSGLGRGVGGAAVGPATR